MLTQASTSCGIPLAGHRQGQRRQANEPAAGKVAEKRDSNARCLVTRNRRQSEWIKDSETEKVGEKQMAVKMPTITTV